MEKADLPAGGAAFAWSAAAAGAVHLRTSFVDVERATAEVGAVQSRDRLVRLVCVGHLDECKAPGAARVPVPHQADAFPGAVPFEQPPNLIFSSAEIQVAYEYVLQCDLSLHSLHLIAGYTRRARNRGGQDMRGQSNVPSVYQLSASPTARQLSLRRSPFGPSFEPPAPGNQPREQLANQLLCLLIRQVPTLVETVGGVRDHHFGLIERVHVRKDENLPQVVLRARGSVLAHRGAHHRHRFVV